MRESIFAITVQYMRLISFDELLAWRQESSEFNLIDVRLEEDFNSGRIPGAKNACVLNVSFLDVLATLGCERERPIVVYGEYEDSHESRLASDTLERAGFLELRDFRGGLGEWHDAGQPVDGAGRDRVPASERHVSHQPGREPGGMAWP